MVLLGGCFEGELSRIGEIRLSMFLVSYHGQRALGALVLVVVSV